MFLFRFGLGAETEGGPGEGGGAALGRRGAGDFFGVGVGVFCGGGEVVVAGGVVVAAAGGVREGEVGVVYLLEFFGAGGAFGGVGGDAVGVGF